MAEELRRQEELRAIRREEGLRDQQLLAVATQAAGAPMNWARRWRP
jgi:two-component system sensor histidine kinase RegB